MADIKTRDSVKGTIKAIDKAATAADRMRSAYIQTKENAETSTNPKENNAGEYASDRIENGADRVAHETVHGLDKAGRKGMETTKDNISKAKDKVREFREKRMSQATEKQVSRTVQNKTIKVAEQTEKTVKQSAKSTGKKTIKTVGKGSAKTAQKTVKTAERTSKAAIKTAEKTAKTAQKTAQASAKAAKAAAQAAKATAKAVVAGVKVAVKATIATVKAIIAGTKALIAAIAAGGWVAVVIIIVICLIAAILGSVFGIFFSGEDSGNGMTIQTAIQEINAEYENRISDIKMAEAGATVESSGSRAVWKDVLAVYAVKSNTDPNNAQDVASMDEGKKKVLSEIFWEMNSVESSTETKTVSVLTETDDGNGNIVQTTTEETKTFLYISVGHKTTEEMADKYGFTEEQRRYLAELLDKKNNSLWSSALYGIDYSDDAILQIAQTQIGNVGGIPYWSWYGFSSRVEWCACFVSWCADKCGYIETGVIPKYASCEAGVAWFKDLGQWVDNSAEPAPGMIVFFDWNDKDKGQDDSPDHTGIVKEVRNGRVYTIEGNSGDTCVENSYPIGYFEIFGYGVPAY